MFNDHLIFSNNIYDAAVKLRQIQEANVRSPEESSQLAQKDYELQKAAFIKAHGRYPEMEEIDAMKTSGQGGRHKSSEAFRRNMVKNATSMLGDIAQAGDAETVRQIGQVLRGMADVRDPSVKTLHAENEGDTIPVAAYRKMIQIAKGKYSVPWQEQPLPLSPDVFDGPDPDIAGKTPEIVDAQQQNQYTGRIDAVRQQPPVRSTGPTARDVTAMRYRESH
jgi:hypothetical protein